MSSSYLSGIDWDRPWLSNLRDIAQPLLTAVEWRDALSAELLKRGTRNHSGIQLRAVPQAELPAGVAYEAFIAAAGAIPTRDNLHDFFNGLIWLAYPRIKAQLNAMQAAEIIRRQNERNAVRGSVRDAATIFDENAALLVTCDPEIVAQLRNHAWSDALWNARADFHSRSDFRLFGHALIEKLVNPYKAITAHTYALEVGEEYFGWSEEHRRAWVDEQLAVRLARGLAKQDFMPVPVLGIPEWWPAQTASFYLDAKVFRPKKSA